MINISFKDWLDIKGYYSVRGYWYNRENRCLSSNIFHIIDLYLKNYERCENRWGSSPYFYDNDFNFDR